MLYPPELRARKSVLCENSEPIRALVRQFIGERKFPLNVTPKTIIWYGCGFKAFQRALEFPAGRPVH